MKEVIKQQLMLMLERLEGWESGGWEQEQARREDPNYDDWFNPDNVYWIADFVNDCALESEEYEIAGIAEALRRKARSASDAEYRLREEREKARKRERWESCEWINPRDIGELLHLGMYGTTTKVNELLERFGYQRRGEEGGWIATDKSEGLCNQIPAEEGKRKRPRLEWKLEIVDRLKGEIRKANTSVP
ncbi:MAG: hypothetical protein ACREVE_16385 [Gammaproteobacteria bacterium]